MIKHLLVIPILSGLCGVSSAMMNPSSHMGESYQTSSTSLRRLNVPVSESQYLEFQTLKYENDPLAASGGKSKLHLYGIYQKDIGIPVLKVLGTGHDIPLDALPSSFLGHLDAADEVYVEGESLFHLSALKPKDSQLNVNLSDNLLTLCESSFLGKLLTLLNPHLKIRDLNAEQLYSIVCIADMLLGMDAEITLRALSKNKPVLMLDEDWDLYHLSLQIHEHGMSAKTRGKYLNDMGQINHDLLVSNFLEKKTSQYLTFPDLLERQEVLEDYSCTDVNEEEEFEPNDPMNVNGRNERWFKILSHKITEEPMKNKLCCVGIGHLYGLFKLFEASGYQIRILETNSN
jgi:hypothetical protein